MGQTIKIKSASPKLSPLCGPTGATAPARPAVGVIPPSVPNKPPCVHPWALRMFKPQFFREESARTVSSHTPTLRSRSGHSKKVLVPSRLQL